MRKILLGLSVIVAVAAVVVGATTAFYGDEETSTGNVLAAGAIDLGIDNESYYNGDFNPGTSWALNLDLDEGCRDPFNPGGPNIPCLFFGFDDLKPGDWGEDTVSVHVDDNDSWLCADVTLTSDDDNVPTEPELDVPDPNTGVGLGELADAVNFIWWADDGDNVLETCRGWQGEEECVQETLLPSGPLGVLGVGGTATVALADSTQNIWGDAGALPGDSTRYIGKAWCFGDFDESWLFADGLPVQDGGDQGRNPSQPGMGVVCDGSNENNITQTDSLTADITFRAEQSRNNPGFECNPSSAGE